MLAAVLTRYGTGGVGHEMHGLLLPEGSERPDLFPDVVARPPDRLSERGKFLTGILFIVGVEVDFEIAAVIGDRDAVADGSEAPCRFARIGRSLENGVDTVPGIGLLLE